MKKVELLQDRLLTDISSVMRNFILETQREIKNNSNISDEKKSLRCDLSEIKSNHSNRCASDVYNTIMGMGFHESWAVIGYLIAELHDIGRQIEAENCDSYITRIVSKYYQNSKICKKRNIEEHAHLADIFLFGTKFKAMNAFYDIYQLDSAQRSKFSKIIKPAIKYHQMYENKLPIHLKDNLEDKTLDSLKQINLFELIINPPKAQNPDLIRQISTFFLHLMRDVDKIDILYQHLTGEFPVLRETVSYEIHKETSDGKIIFDDSLETVAQKFELTIEQINKVNPNGVEFKINDKTKETKVSIQLPLKKIKPKFLMPTDDIWQMFYSGEINSKLNELQSRRFYSPITGLLWRLSNFIKGIKYTEFLVKILEFELLEKIKNQFPEEYHFLVNPAIDFIKDYIENTIRERKGKTYTKEQ